IIGNFNNNTEFGIVGKINNNNFSNLPSYQVADLSEIKLDKAYVLLQNKDNKVEKYEIEIVNIYNQDYPQSKTFKIKITDKRLLAYTGGVVQGMSGTPIIQNNKVIGAISHAIENYPSYGYAVYIGWMLKGDKLLIPFFNFDYLVIYLVHFL
ncbi:MAG TPA: SpoIVB peptidase S55 domain-containing protein, partial [Peptostreptococcaceae bacterium]|nr:SpoIVB peptidase S55 domain-containing protein [Peptostreptococcaceae bacterium]